MNVDYLTDGEGQHGFMPVEIVANGLWRARALIFASALAGMACAMLVLVVIRPTYTARATITLPAGGGPTPSGSVSGLATLVGIPVGGSDVTSTYQKFLETTRSRRLAAALEQKHHVLRIVFPGWDNGSQRFLPPSGLGAVKQFVKELLGRPAWQPPDAVSLSEYLDENIKVSSSHNSNSVADQTKEIAYVSDSPALARDFLAMVIDTADDVVRNDKLTNERNRIDYLNQALDKTHELYLRESLGQLLQTEQRQMMVLQADRYYSFDMVDPPAADNIPTAPKAAFIVVAGFFGGLMLGAAYAFLLIRRRAITAAGVYDPLAAPFPNPFLAVGGATRKLLRLA
jgi:LPS O-antigen subunit length determinant protein (WzzB/FepE family)